MVRVEPPRLLVFEWFEEGAPATEVSWELKPRGQQTLLVLSHRRLASRAAMIDVSGGWHLHLDVLEDVLADRPPRPFWARHEALEREYSDRIASEHRASA